MTVCAVAMPSWTVSPSAEAAEKAKAGKKGKHYGDADSVGFFQMRVGSTAGKSRKLTRKRQTVGDDAQHLNFKMQEQMRQHSQARTMQSGVAKKQDETKKGMVKKMK